MFQGYRQTRGKLGSIKVLEALNQFTPRTLENMEKRAP